MDFMARTLNRKVKPYIVQLHDEYIKYKRNNGNDPDDKPLLLSKDKTSVNVNQENYNSSEHIYDEPHPCSESSSSEQYPLAHLNGSSGNVYSKSTDSGLCSNTGSTKADNKIKAACNPSSVPKYNKYNQGRYQCISCARKTLAQEKTKLMSLSLPERVQMVEKYPSQLLPRPHTYRKTISTSEFSTPPPKPPRTATNLTPIRHIIPDKTECVPVNITSSLKEPVYAEINNIFTSSPNGDIKKSDTKEAEPIYAKVTPKRFRDSNTSSIPSNNSSSALLEEYNELLSKETKEQLNLIHKTSWKLQKITNEAEKSYEEDRFVVNTFESRPSKRWMRKLTSSCLEKKSYTECGPEPLNWSKDKTNAEMSVGNSTEFSLEYGDIDENIIRLEKESRALQDESKKIEKELAYLQHEELQRRYNKLEIDKKKIEWRLSQVSTSVGTTEESVYLLHESRRIDEELDMIRQEATEEYHRYRILKEARDIECARMSQASNALIQIRNRNGARDWIEVLVAEKLLLETSERVQLFTNEIRDAMYSSIPDSTPHKGRLRLSNISFPFMEDFHINTKANKHYTDFFVVTISYGTQMEISEYITGEEGPLTFNKTCIFEDVTPVFEINVKLHCLRLKTSEEHIWDKLRWCTLCPNSRIIYEDLLTHRYEDKKVFKTAFKLCAEATLTSAHIDETSIKLKVFPEVFSKLNDTLVFNLNCEKAYIDSNISGFLDVGVPRGDALFWERKWCVLRGTDLCIYRYPQEEYLGNPCDQLNLEYCFGSVITNLAHCPKKRAFQLKTGRPTKINCTDSQETNTMRTKPNFCIEKYFFAAGCNEDYLSWTEELQKTLTSLSDFKKLVFREEYIEILRGKI